MKNEKMTAEQSENLARAQLLAKFGETPESVQEIIRENTARRMRKKYTWYIAVGIAALAVMAAGEAAAIVFVPVLLVMVFVGFWAFDVK